MVQRAVESATSLLAGVVLAGMGELPWSSVLAAWSI